ncbi:MAG: hypothetical protein DRP86_06905, partial [Candidatus Neomarinimicrobiota bacterium]
RCDLMPKPTDKQLVGVILGNAVGCDLMPKPTDKQYAKTTAATITRCDLMPKPTLSDIIKKKNINNSLNLIGVIPVKII